MYTVEIFKIIMYSEFGLGLNPEYLEDSSTESGDETESENIQESFQEMMDNHWKKQREKTPGPHYDENRKNYMDIEYPNLEQQ